MKGFEKFLLILFSIIVIIVSVSLVLIATEMMDGSFVTTKILEFAKQYKTYTLIIGSIFALLGLIGLFSSSDSSDSISGGLAIKSDTGTVYINRDTFENIILGVARNFPELKNVKADIQITEQGVIVNVNTMISPDTIVPELTEKLQESIKSSILKQTTVEIKEANIKIKGVYFNPKWYGGHSSTFAGLEIADLFSYPIHQYVKYKKPNKSFQAIESKIASYPDYTNRGLKIYPREKDDVHHP